MQIIYWWLYNKLSNYWKTLDMLRQHSIFWSFSSIYHLLSSLACSSCSLLKSILNRQIFLGFFFFFLYLRQSIKKLHFHLSYLTVTSESSFTAVKVEHSYNHKLCSCLILAWTGLIFCRSWKGEWLNEHGQGPDVTRCTTLYHCRCGREGALASTGKGAPSGWNRLGFYFCFIPLVINIVAVTLLFLLSLLFQVNLSYLNPWSVLFVSPIGAGDGSDRSF